GNPPRRAVRMTRFELQRRPCTSGSRPKAAGRSGAGACVGVSLTVVDPTAPSPTVGFSSTVDAASAAGLVHMRARDYDPVTGQFLTPDPWQRPDGVPWVGVHAYTDGDPVSFWDPDGLRPKHNGCAPKRDGRGGPTGCDVEQEVYRLVCETAVYKGVSFFSWGDLARAGYYAGSDA